MTAALENIEISGEMVASPKETKAHFDKTKIQLNTTTEKPILLIFSAKYTWMEEQDGKLNTWDFYMTISDETGDEIYSDFRHFGMEEPGLIGEDEKSFKEYLREESYLKHYKEEHPPRSGDGILAKSITTPTSKGEYTYNVRLTAQFWSQDLDKEMGLENIKTESTARCTVKVVVD